MLLTPCTTKTNRDTPTSPNPTHISHTHQYHPTHPCCTGWSCKITWVLVSSGLSPSLPSLGTTTTSPTGTLTSAFAISHMKPGAGSAAVLQRAKRRQVRAPAAPLPVRAEEQASGCKHHCPVLLQQGLQGWHSKAPAPKRGPSISNSPPERWQEPANTHTGFSSSAGKILSDDTSSKEAVPPFAIPLLTSLGPQLLSPTKPHDVFWQQHFRSASSRSWQHLYLFLGPSNPSLPGTCQGLTFPTTQGVRSSWHSWWQLCHRRPEQWSESCSRTGCTCCCAGRHQGGSATAVGQEPLRGDCIFWESSCARKTSGPVTARTAARGWHTVGQMRRAGGTGGPGHAP